jgi:VWFA-related protein
VLQQRPAPKPAGIQLDVVVTDKQGGSVTGLELKDFTVLDNKKAQNILSCQSGGPTQADTPVEVILLLDLVNTPFEQAAATQAQIAKFLQQNGGRLAYPTSIAIFSNDNLRLQPTPSTDGNHLAAALNATAQAIGGKVSHLDEVARFQLSLRTLLSIAQNQAKTPAHKILIWTGPGWPLLVGSNYAASSQDRQRYFDVIVAASTALREAHFALYSVSLRGAVKGGASAIAPPQPYYTPNAEAPLQSRPSVPRASDAVDGSSYKEFLKEVRTVRQADSGALALQVFAVQSGGRVLDPGNDLANQLAQCQGDAAAFYRISFRPDPAAHVDDYHGLKVEVGRPGLVARTSTGFYNQP